MREITAGINEKGQRLDKLCIKYLSDAPRSFIYKMIRKKNITLNGHRCEGNEILNEGDTVRFWLSDETIEKFCSDTEVLTPTVPIPEIIYEDDDILIFNKPAGMLSQKSKPDDISVNDLLIAYLISSGSLNEDDLKTFRPSICNRLDRNTSGLIICGKSLHGLQEMSGELRERSAHKDYIAFVKGTLREGMSLKGYLRKDNPTNTVKVGAEGERIETDFKPLWTDGQMSVIMVRLITGKTHQIRAHLSSIGHPIIGDPKYGDGKGAKRQLLHAFRITMPDGRTFIAPLPEDMKWEHGKQEAFEDLPWRI